MTFQEFAHAHAITASSKKSAFNRNMPEGAPMDHYSVTLRLGGCDEYTLVFSKGLGHKGEPPSAAEVLESLAMEARGAIGHSFENWASEFGYDTDSRKALRTYQTIVSQSCRLEKFLGAYLYNALLVCEE